MGACRAECLAWVQPGASGTTLLSRGRCPDSAMNDLTPLLHQDVPTSDVQGFPRKDGVVCAPLCRAHSNQYLVARQVARCCVEGCPEVWHKQANGLKVCHLHEGSLAPTGPRAHTRVGPVPQLVPLDATDAPGPGNACSPVPGAPVIQTGATGPTGAQAAASPRSTLYDARVLYGEVGQAGRYYRFLAQRDATNPDGTYTLNIPTLGWVCQVHKSVVGPWSDDWWDSLMALRLPVLATRWERPKEDLRLLEGTAMDGATIPSAAFSRLRQGSPGRSQFLSKVTACHGAHSPLTDQPKRGGQPGRGGLSEPSRCRRRGSTTRRRR